MSVCVCSCACACGHQKSMFGVFLRSLFYILDNLSLNLELTSLASLTGQEESGILLSHPSQDLALRCVLPCWDFYMGSGMHVHLLLLVW